MALDLDPDRLESLVDHATERVPGIGQRDLPGLAHEQQAAPIALQLADLVADRGRADAKLRGSVLEAQVPGRRLEGSQRGQGRRWRGVRMG